MEELSQTPTVSATNSLDRDFKRKIRDQSFELRIQEAFLRFMASILRGYRDYLVPISKAPTVGSTDPNAVCMVFCLFSWHIYQKCFQIIPFQFQLFQLNAFLRSRDKAHHKFYNYLMKTQMFIRFIEERSFVTDSGYQGLAFFDECTEKVSACDDTTNEIRFVDWDIGASSDRTKYILPLDSSGDEQTTTTDTTTYTYPFFVLNPALLHPPKNHLNKLIQSAATGAPGSPMARRTKYEIKMAQKIARKCQSSPEQWANHLLTTCYSIHFLVLPSILLDANNNEQATLKAAYDVLSKAHKMRITCDEVCYRVMMQLCGIHNLPILAVRLYYLMKRSGIQPNAVTYGFYNKCVLEAQWPSDTGTASKLRWNRLKNVIFAVGHLRRGIQAGRRKYSSDQHLNGLDEHAASATSLENDGNYFSIDFFAFDKLRGRFGNFGRSGERNDSNLRASAGSLTSIGKGENEIKTVNGNNHHESEIDPRANERITADNIERIKEPPPEQYESQLVKGQHQKTMRNGNASAQGDENDAIKDHTDVAVNGKSNGCHDNADDEDDEDKTSPKK